MFTILQNNVVEKTMLPLRSKLNFHFRFREKVMSNLIKANVASVTRMTGLALPGMVKRGKGVIINIGSASSIIPSPLLTVYAASKVYRLDDRRNC